MANGGRCNLRGVLKITPPKWAQSVSYHMAAENSTLFSLNIGDSLTNNAWGKGRWEGGSKKSGGRRDGTRGGLEGGRVLYGREGGGGSKGMVGREGTRKGEREGESKGSEVRKR